MDDHLTALSAPKRHPTRGGTLRSLLHRYRPRILMISLVAEILFSPYLDHHPHTGILTALVTLALVFALSSYTAPRWVLKYVVGPLASAWAASRFMEALGLSYFDFAQLASVLGLALSLSVLWLMLRRFSAIADTSGSLITEAFISYLLIAISFSQLYEIVDRTVPHAFNRPIPPPRGSTMLYFSLTSLTSLGSNDLTAIDPYLRIAAALESLVGIFYIAVVVARLVSSTAALSAHNRRGSAGIEGEKLM